MTREDGLLSSTIWPQLLLSRWIPLAARASPVLVGPKQAQTPVLSLKETVLDSVGMSIPSHSLQLLLGIPGDFVLGWLLAEILADELSLCSSLVTAPPIPGSPARAQDCSPMLHLLGKPL